MCQAVVYLNNREIMRDVVRVEPVPERVRLTVFFEPPQVVPAVIREIDLLKHRVILEPLAERARPPEAGNRVPEGEG